MTATVAIRARTNADWSRAFVYQDTAGNPIDITGATFKMTVRKRADTAEALVVSTPDKGIKLTTPAAGKFSVKLSQSQLNSLGPGEFVHDLIAVFPSGSIEPIWEGTLVNVQGVTRL